MRHISKENFLFQSQVFPNFLEYKEDEKYLLFLKQKVENYSEDEKNIGISGFFDNSEQIVKGTIRTRLNDFKVMEVFGNKNILNIKECEEKQEKYGNFLQFKMTKSNIDTISAIREISKKSGLPENFFFFCGLKDKRAKTYQLVRAFKGKKNQFQKIRKIEGKNFLILLSKFVYKEEAFFFGSNDGNDFEIMLRNFFVVNDFSQDFAENYLKQVGEKGFINFFGNQRFGQLPIKTYEIGISILKENYEDAIKSILMASCSTFKGSQEVVDFFQNRNYKKMKDFLKKFSLFKEMEMISFLEKNRFDCKTALFECTPNSLMKLYIQSYQSYIWNQVASARFKEYGKNVVIGDLVQFFDPETETTKVHLISNYNEIENFDIYNVVLPIGNSKLFPKTEKINKKTYLDLMERDGFDFKTLNEINERFSFRKLVLKPKNFVFSWRKDKNTCKLNFFLEKGSFATSLLREILKSSYEEFSFNYFSIKNLE